MSWYYQKGQEQAGPVDEKEVLRLASTGEINDLTLVWKEGMSGWKSYVEVKDTFDSSDGNSIQSSQGEMVTCSVSGKSVPKREAIELNGRWVSAEHKNEALERIKSGVGLDEGIYNYIGFWWRVLARLVDGIITSIVSYALMFLLAIPFGVAGFASNLIGQSSDASAGTVGIYFIIQLVCSLGIPMAYEVFLIGKFGATIGKKLIGAKVIRSDGSKLTYMRAFGRYWGIMLSGIILYIGYIMVAFDREKRGLHDKLCDTLVVRNN
ncbi:MAG: RDD family protein [Verrucomicrobiota bacterium]